MLNDKLNLIEIMQDIVSSYDIDYINVNKFRDSLRKMDCVVEQNKPIHLPRIRKLQNWDTRPFIEKIAYVRRNEWVYIPNLYKDPDPYFSKTIPKYGIESVYYVAIYNYNVIESDGEPQFWGFVSYGWSKPTNISQKDLAALLKEKYRFEEYILKK